MADEATQGIDPDGSERIMEEAHVIPLWQGINPAVNDSEWCWFHQTSIESHLGNMSVGSQRLCFTADANVSHSYPLQKHCNL